MTAPINIIDSKTGAAARVTPFGQLVVAPLQYSEPKTLEMTVAGQPYNFIEPSAGHSVVITDIITSADKTVSNVVPANIIIFSADAVDSVTPTRVIVRPQLIRAANLPLIGLNLLVPEGRWVNATTDDINILLTIMFYRVPVERFINV